MKTHTLHGKMPLVAICAVAFLAIASPAFAQNGRDIMQAALDVAEPAFSHSAVSMELIEADGSSETRMVEEWGKDADGLISTVIVFRSPASVKDTRFLQVEHADRDADKWIYLPALRNTRRVASSDGDKAFMGTDVTYDDMNDRAIDEDTHELVGEESVNGYDCYTVRSTPVDASDSQYGYRITYVDKDSYVPVKIEMYDRQGELLKVMNVESLEQRSGYWIPMTMTMENVQSGHSTRITVLQIEIDNPISERLFTTNFLNTGRI